MKKHWYALIFTAGLAAVSNTVAYERPSCEQLGYIAETLDYIYSSFGETQNITEGDEVDIALGVLVESLENIVITENNPALSAAVTELAQAWEEMNGALFRQALDKVINSFILIYQRDCE
jgi:hypothetical protein